MKLLVCSERCLAFATIKIGRETRNYGRTKEYL